MRLLVPLACAILACAKPPDLRLALRLDPHQVLLIGAELQSVDEPHLARYPKSPLHSDLQPGESIYLFDHAAPWRRGDRWQLYPETRVRIDQLGVITYCGGIGGYEIAIARADHPLQADVFVGQSSRPARGLQVAPASLATITLPPADSAKLTALLVREARDIVKAEDWMVLPGEPAEHADRIRRANRSVLSGALPPPQLRVQRWTPRSGSPLLFIEAVWLAPNGDPLFACDAIFFQGAATVQRWFSARKAERMRESFGSNDWSLDSRSPFLAAYEIEGRPYVLLYEEGYEGFRVSLQELVPLKGLVPTGITFGAGC